VLLAIASSLLSGCDRGTPTTPTAVTVAQPEPTLPNSPVSGALSGTVTASGGGPVAGARVEVTSGANAGRSAIADAAGRYALTNLSAGIVSLRITAAAYLTHTQDLTVGASQIADITLTPVPFQARGRVFDVDTTSPLSGISMTGDAMSAEPSSSTGTFVVFAANDSSAPRLILLDGPGIVSRHTSAHVPGPDIALSLIASTFDLPAFDQMVRTPMLYRWTSPPPLIVERRTLGFTGENASTATAEDDVMTDAEVASLESDLRTALPTMTGGVFAAFAGTERRTANPGDTVSLLNTGSITVLRMAGLTVATGFWGFGRFEVQSDGTVVSGMVMLDRDFERSGHPSVRTLTAHELGHALGYSHVSMRISVMNADAGTAPTAWDGAAFRIAFQRMPGNRSPDIDPSTAAASAAGGSAQWVRAIR
jgi:hypothetical protein